MPRYFLVLLMVLASAFALTAGDVSGKWKGTFTPENGQASPALVILTQTGDKVTGTAGPDESERHEIANGSVVGDTVTFDIVRDQGSIRFVLKVQADSLGGQITREGEGGSKVAQLKLTREK